MTLYIIRHAWAGHFGDPQWPDDELRPLSDEGRDRFAQVAKKLNRRGVAPEVIATSPLVRCRQTAEILAEHVGEPPVIELDALQPRSDLDALVQWTNDQEGVDVAWVGHAPDVGELTAALVGSPDGEIRFAKAACAAIRFDDVVAPAHGELQWLATAKLLGC